MTETELRHYKEIYKHISVSDLVIEQNWESLRGILPARQSSVHRHIYQAAFLLAVVSLFFIAGTVKVAQASRPGDLLYSVKIVSDEVIAKVTGKQSTIIEKRAEELIKESEHNESNDSTRRVEKAAEAYENALQESKKDVKGLQTNDKGLGDTIATQESKLRHVTPNNPKVEKILEKSIEKTEQVKNEAVKTKAEKEKESDDSNSNEVKENNTSNIPQPTPEEKGNKK